MGRAKQLLRLLRSRLPSLKADQCLSPPRWNGSGTSYTYANSADVPFPTTTTLPEHDGSTRPTTPSTTPCKRTRKKSTSGFALAIHKVAALQCIDGDKDGFGHCSVRVQAELAASQAMLDFAKKLPWEELGMVGRGLDVSKNTVGGLTVEQETAPPTDYTSKRNSCSSHTHNLSSRSSDSTWSFACRLARRMEREHTDTASSFGSLSGWGVSYNDNIAGAELVGESVDVEGHKNGPWSDASPCKSMSNSARLHLDGGIMAMSEAEFDALPDYSDAESDAETDETF